jgi:hypothetical protein
LLERKKAGESELAGAAAGASGDADAAADAGDSGGWPSSRRPPCGAGEATTASRDATAKASRRGRGRGRGTAAIEEEGGRVGRKGKNDCLVVLLEIPSRCGNLGGEHHA